MSNSMGPYRALSSGVSGLMASLTPGTRILPLTSTREFIRAITSAIASWLQHRVHFIRATTLQHRVHFIRATTLQQSSVCQSNHTTTQSSHQSNHYNTEFTSSEQFTTTQSSLHTTTESQSMSDVAHNNTEFTSSEQLHYNTEFTSSEQSC